MHLVGFIIRIYHDARSPERQILTKFTTVRHLVNFRQTNPVTPRHPVYLIYVQIFSFHLRPGLPQLSSFQVLSLKCSIHFSSVPNAYILPISSSLISSWEHDLVEYKWCTFSLRNFLHSLIPSSLFAVNKDSTQKPVCRHPQSML